VDLLVDGDNDMVQSIDTVLAQIANEDLISLLRFQQTQEVPNLIDLKNVLSQERKRLPTIAIDPVFILDQTFCPNVHFFREEDILATVRNFIC
jgi:hypothetical protein